MSEDILKNLSGERAAGHRAGLGYHPTFDLTNLQFWSVKDQEPHFSWAKCENKKCPHEGHLGGMRYDCEAHADSRSKVEIVLCEGCMVDFCG